MLTVGDPFPHVTLTGVSTAALDTAFAPIDTAELTGRWSVVFTWPKDFTFVCPTELVAFGQVCHGLAELDTDLYGVSTDSEFVHLAWRQSDPRLADLPYPMLADVKRELCSALGIIDRSEGVALRSTFVIDPTGTIRFVSVHDLDTGRNVDEVVRTVAALQSGGLTACGWQPGDRTLSPA